MVVGLERVQEARELHFVTFSCFGRRGYLEESAARDLFEDALQKVHLRYRFAVVGYVVMPEHVHLLVSEPKLSLLGVALQALKLSVVRRSRQNPFWLARYYDFNVRTESRRIEKLNYMHWNPMKRGAPVQLLTGFLRGKYSTIFYRGLVERSIRTLFNRGLVERSIRTGLQLMWERRIRISFGKG